MTINCKGNLIDLSQPKIIGILNVTPDSFFDGGKYVLKEEMLFQVEKMLTEGATFIDVGAYSSKPNASVVSQEEEIGRLLPAIDLILKEFPTTLISVDTFRSEVAKTAVAHGVAIVNDISAGSLDATMLPTIAALQVPYIMMHMRGTPQTMQSFTQYENLMQEILFYFSERIALARNYGINDLIVDPGFGFAKTVNQNFEILKSLELFQMLELPLLVGVSRKSMIYKTLNSTPQESLNGTTVLNTIALQKKAAILRVHDVKEAQECIKLYQQIN